MALCGWTFRSSLNSAPYVRWPMWSSVVFFTSPVTGRPVGISESHWDVFGNVLESMGWWNHRRPVWWNDGWPCCFFQNIVYLTFTPSWELNVILTDMFLGWNHQPVTRWCLSWIFAYGKPFLLILLVGKSTWWFDIVLECFIWMFPKRGVPPNHPF